MKKFFNKKTSLKFSGQTAIELAVFGSILIFVIGSIVKQHMSFAYTQNENLKALRWAMTTSYMHTMGIVDPRGDGNDGTSSRNQSTVLLLEDRLQVGAEKHSPIDRIPYVATASAMFSRNLFLGLETNEWYNIPVLDLFVNGKHFVLRVAGFKTVSTAPKEGDSDIIKCGEKKTCTAWHEDGDGNYICDNWDTSALDCKLLFEKVPNFPQIEDWCINSCDNLPLDMRFDLDHSGSIWSSAYWKADGTGTYLGDVGTADSDVPGPNAWDYDRGSFSWQWHGVPAYDEDSDSESSLFATTAENTYGMGISIDDSENLMVDVDSDLKEERVLKVSSDSTGVITSMDVVDYQEGDYDTTEDSLTEGRSLGITSDLQLFTFVKSGLGDKGTYLLIEQGKLYNPANGQYIRSVQKKDQVDIVQRILQLSRNTGRFCNGVGSTNVTGTVSSDDFSGYDAGWTKDIPNPVEACQDCFIQGNVGKTCFDSTSNPDYEDRPVIYVRSRLQDLHGRKWLTPLEDDFSTGHYVDFDVPSVP